MIFRRRASAPARLHVFVVTYGRSGSSLLQKVLASLPGAHVCGENNDALAGLWASVRAVRQASEEQGGERRAKPGDPWRGADRIDPAAYEARLVQAFVETVLQAPAAARIVGFKEVRWFDHDDDLEPYLDWVRAAFRPALLVFNRRDPEAVARSAWWKDHPADIAAAVRRFDARADAYAARRPAEAVSLDYDAWSRDPAHLRPLLDRVGAPWDEAALRALLRERLDH